MTLTRAVLHLVSWTYLLPGTVFYPVTSGLRETRCRILGVEGASVNRFPLWGCRGGQRCRGGFTMQHFVSGESLAEIFDQVLRVLEANGNTHRPGLHARGG